MNEILMNEILLNEILLISSLFVTYAGILLIYRILGEQGLYMWTVLATIAANIEVLIVVDAFGMEQTLGNILFASTFLVTDMLSELYGKKQAKKAVHIGIVTSISFIIISQSWMLYQPNETDFAMPHIRAIFSNTPRLMIAGILVYVIVQMFDVWVYHKWWEFTTKKFGDSHRFLWLRNNGSTLISQLLNTILFTLAAFLFVYDEKTLLSIAGSSYLIFIVASLVDTPFIYWARKIYLSTFCMRDSEKVEK